MSRLAPTLVTHELHVSVFLTTFPLSLSRFHPPRSAAFAPFARLLSFSNDPRPSPSADIHRFSVSVVLPAGSESVHKRVINYLRVGHVFPPCSPTSTSFSLSLPLSFSAPTIDPRPAAFSVSTRHGVSFVTLSRFRTRCPRAHSVCTHALMLIRLNAPKASRGSRARFQKLRPITNRDPRGGHGRPRGK